jgi:hypothetical protein
MAVYDDENGFVWVRPMTMFEGTLSDGRKRFEPL